jgi:transposase
MTAFSELFEQDLQISQVTVADEITLTLHAMSPTAAYPACGTISTRIHSHCRRTVHDLPNRKRPVHLVLQVRRFRCQESTCACKIFAEQFPALARPYAQRTIQLQEALRHLGLALGGQAGTRLGSELGISGSRDTILRLVQAMVLPLIGDPKKVSVDDWVWKRGHRYGTLICDLERGMPIELLRIRVLSSAHKDPQRQERQTRSADDYQRRSTKELRAGGEHIPDSQLTAFRMREAAQEPLQVCIDREAKGGHV